jgi:hypothetical protein
MPGTRSLSRELALHSTEFPARFAAIHAQLVSQLPEHDRALVGWQAILRYLHNTLGLRRPGGKSLHARIVLRWRRDHMFPLLRGGWNPRCRKAPRSAPLTTTYAATAWTLCEFDTARRRPLCVLADTRVGAHGNGPVDRSRLHHSYSPARRSRSWLRCRS